MPLTLVSVPSNRFARSPRYVASPRCRRRSPIRFAAIVFAPIVFAPIVFAAIVFAAVMFADRATAAGSDEYRLHTFERVRLTDTYYSEGIAAGDIDGDGNADVVYGPHWYAGPEFGQRHEIYPAVAQDRNRYADHFFAWTHDFDGDGRLDVLTVGFPGTPAYVYENPGPDGFDRPWPKHEVFDQVSNESPQFVDITGNGTPELVCTRDGFYGFATYDTEDPFSAWEFHPVSGQVAAARFGHGLGVGDVNGDGRADLVHAKGWFEQPARDALDSRWRSHAVKFSHAYGGAEMLVYDVDGDGLNDVITSEAAHEFGVSWYQQVGGEGDDAGTSFRRHVIVGDTRADNRYGVLFSEPHSLTLADIDGDGLMDLVTGKTFYSHHQKSPMWDAGAVVYWFRLTRGDNGVDWVPFRADGKAGIGRQVIVEDVDGDGQGDILAGGMKGAHLLRHRSRRVDREQWEAAEPSPYVPPKDDVSSRTEPLRGPKSSIDGASGRVAGAIEGESLKATVSGGQARAQGMKNFSGDRWSGGEQVFWTGGRPGESFRVELNNDRPRDRLEVVLTCAPDYGIVQLELDGKPIGPPIDCYAPSVVTTGVLTLTDRKLPKGKLTLTARIVGSNPKAKRSYFFGLDYVRPVAEGETFAKPAPDPDTVGVAARGGDARAAPPIANLVPDEYPHAGVSAAEAARAMTLPDGFRVTVGAAEPDVKQPIAMALDHRGRVWIAEAYEYPVRAEGERGRDRILVFEDTDGDGTLDRRKVFCEGLNLVSGLEVGFGGVWVGAAPYLLFIPDRDGDDVPDGDPEVVLDGWGHQDTHETLNAFIWGPDGWLYGCHGVFTHSAVGKPGTPDDERVRINAGVWRYHPTREEFEVFAHGTSNPWGIDFNDHGKAFITACVIPHLYHVIDGGRYQRQAGQHFNPHTYRDLVTIADHLHYSGATPHSGNNKSDAVGGGHAHAGAMIYLGDAWPEQYRGALLMNNIHGQRLNVDRLEPQGSGYVGTHAPDFLLTGDQASQILNLRYGPDGNVWMIDWYDMQACHRREADAHDRSNGRIYQIRYSKTGDSKAGRSKAGDSKAGGSDGTGSATTIDLNEASDGELAELTLHANDWYVRHARRALQERAAIGELDEAARGRLVEIATSDADDTRVLRAMWGLHVSGGVPESVTEAGLRHTSPHVRGWSARLRVDGEPIDDAFRSRLEQIAADDPSPVTRLDLASIAARIDVDDRWTLLIALCGHDGDADDHNLPLMLWYAAEPLAERDSERALQFAMEVGPTMPLVRELMLRRIASLDGDSSIDVLVRGLAGVDESEMRLRYLEAIRNAFRGRRQVRAPEGWAAVDASLRADESAEVRQIATELGVQFGDPDAIARVRSRLGDRSAPVADRRRAIETLLEIKDPQLVPTLHEVIVRDEDLRETAIRGLAQYRDADPGETLIGVYASLTAVEKRTALATLCGRVSGAMAVLAAIESGKMPASDLTADLVRQIRYLRDEKLTTRLTEVWGTVRESEADKLEQIEQIRQLVESDSYPDPDPMLGRAVFAKTCQNCHVLFAAGSKVGPDLTGSNRTNLDYLLSNIVDPSAVMAKEYQPTVVLTDDGRLVVGLIDSEDDNVLRLRTAEAVVAIPKGEIEERTLGEQSMMPDDQLRQFEPHQVRSLIAYLQSRAQVPMLATPDNVGLLFNGSDLTGWSGSESLWGVEEGELVGRSDGLRRNEWLISDLAAENFRLSLEVKLVDHVGNSGIQFRSEATDGSVRGYQADIGAGWWGKLYEEHGRQLLWDESGERHLRPGEWNRYEIEARGSRIQTFLNGNLCVDLDDPDGARRGIFALQLHSGGPTEVRFREIRLQVLNATE